MNKLTSNYSCKDVTLEEFFDIVQNIYDNAFRIETIIAPFCNKFLELKRSKDNKTFEQLKPELLEELFLISDLGEDTLTLIDDLEIVYKDVKIK